MVIYYAVGSGLGHLARAAAFLYTQKIAPQSVVLLSSSDYCESSGLLPEGLTVIKIPQEFSSKPLDYEKFLSEILHQYNISEVYLDVFPTGILGEWKPFFGHQGIKFYYLARLLNWNNYQKILADFRPHFEKIYRLEPLTAIHEDFLVHCSTDIANIALKYPTVAVAAPEYWEVLKQYQEKQKEIWLVIHSEPAAELLELLAYAHETAKIRNKQPVFWVISQSKIHTHLEHHLLHTPPCEALFEAASLIFTACGFNLSQQTKPYRQKHLFLPFYRYYDLQFERAKRIRKEQT